MAEVDEGTDRAEAVEVRQDGVLQSRAVKVIGGLFALLVGLVIVGVVALIVVRNSRSQPLEVPLYPDAQEVSSERLREGQQQTRYMVNAPLELVEQFYRDVDGMVCQRQYETVTERPGQAPLREGHLYTRCQLDHSLLNVTQYAIVTIRPAVDADGAETEPIVVDVQQVWGD